MSIRALVVDDEAPARRRVRRLLQSELDVSVVGECGDGAAAIAAIERDRPDLVFLDVQMPEQDGFAVVAAVAPAALPAILFVTAHDRYALRAFDVHAVDYLLKPFTPERFRRALARARARIAARTPDPALAALADSLRRQASYVSRVTVRVGERLLVIDLATVDWMEAADNYVKLHVQQREFLLRETLSGLEARLDPQRFVRIHRSVIVPLDRVAAVRAASHGDADLELRDGTRLTVSRTWRERLKTALARSSPH